MKTYFFHLRDGVDVLLDPDGRQLTGLPAAIAAALVEARSIIGADALLGTILLEQRIDVEDELGTIVHSLEFEDAVQLVRATVPPATGHGAIEVSARPPVS
jgi:hypothetical protein